MKKSVLVLLFCTVVLVNGYSQTKVDLIRELFKVMHQDSVIDKTFSSVIPSMFSQMQSQMKGSTAKARSQEAMKSSMMVMKDIAKRMIDEDMAAIYDKNFTENEIKDFIAFYKSTSGQKLVNTQPIIQKELMTVMTQKYLPEIQKAMKANVNK